MNTHFQHVIVSMRGHWRIPAVEDEPFEPPLHSSRNDKRDNEINTRFFRDDLILVKEFSWPYRTFDQFALGEFLLKVPITFSIQVFLVQFFHRLFIDRFRIDWIDRPLLKHIISEFKIKQLIVLSLVKNLNDSLLECSSITDRSIRTDVTL